MENMANKSWRVDEIFQDIPGDANNVNMIIPPEITEYLELKEGDTIRIEVTDSGLTLSKG